MNLLRRAAIVLLICIAAGAAASDINSDVRQTANQLVGSIYTGPSMTTLRELSDGIGGRITGSPAYDRAAEWAAAKFKAEGIPNVKFESFSIPNGWVRGTAHGEMLSPMSRPLHVESLGWSPSTPAGGVTGDVVVVDDFDPAKLKTQTAQLKGKLVFADTSKLFAQGYGKALPAIKAAYEIFAQAGVLCVLAPDRAVNNVINAHDTGWGASVSPLAVAQLGMEDSKLTRRLLEQGPVRVHVELTNTVTGPTQVNNVIAEIRGSEHPEEWILIGAHLDSWDFGTGAQDNGTGSASVLEVARAIASSGKAPRRSIRFALWGGEEQGLLGSYAYTQAHLGEMDKCFAVLNTDNGAGHPKGWKVQSRKDVSDGMKPYSDALLKDIGGGELDMTLEYDTDHGPFMLQGVPALDLLVDMGHYMEIHHKTSDTFDKVDVLDFKAGSAVVAVTAWALAEADKPIAPRLDHAAVGEIIKKADLVELLTNVGQWKP